MTPIEKCHALLSQSNIRLKQRAESKTINKKCKGKRTKQNQKLLETYHWQQK